MVVPESGGELSAALVNAIVLALWAALPGLILGYVRQVLAARKIRPEFALRKSEVSELDRAVRQYDEVCGRLETIEQQAETPTRFWRALFDGTDDVRQSDAEEYDDLQAHAQHLRGTIARLKRRVQRGSQIKICCHHVSRSLLARSGHCKRIAAELAACSAFRKRLPAAWLNGLVVASKAE